MMENEIDLRDLILVLWKGRYIVAAITGLCLLASAIYSFIFIPTRYESTVLIDLSPYGATVQEALHLAGNTGFILDSLHDLDANPREAAAGISVEQIRDTGTLRITSVQPDPDLSATAAEKVGLALLSTEREKRLRRLETRREELTQSIALLDEAIAAQNVDPSIEDYLLASRGTMPEALLQLNPVLRRLLEEKGEMVIQLHRLTLDLRRIESDPALQPENLLLSATDPLAAATNKMLNIVLAGLLGLIASVLIVFFRNFLITSGLLDLDKNSSS